MPAITAFIAILAAALYTGAALYISLVELPAGYSSAAPLALSHWSQTVRRTPRYAALALIATVAGLLHGGFSLQSWWVWGAAVIFAVLPFTVIAVLPVQRRLLALDPAAAESGDVLRQWGRRHALRPILGLAASLIFLWQTVSPG